MSEHRTQQVSLNMNVIYSKRRLSTIKEMVDERIGLPAYWSVANS